MPHALAGALQQAGRIVERRAVKESDIRFAKFLVLVNAGVPAVLLGWDAWHHALGANPVAIIIPCHRVLRTGGAFGGYTGGLERKHYLLELEGLSRP